MRIYWVTLAVTDGSSSLHAWIYSYNDTWGKNNIDLQLFCSCDHNHAEFVREAKNSLFYFHLLSATYHTLGGWIYLRAPLNTCVWVDVAIPPKIGYTTHKYCLRRLSHCVWKTSFECDFLMCRLDSLTLNQYFCHKVPAGSWEPRKSQWLCWRGNKYRWIRKEIFLWAPQLTGKVQRGYWGLKKRDWKDFAQGYLARVP